MILTSHCLYVYSLLFEQKMILYLYKFEPFHSLSLSFSLSLPHRNEDWFVCLVSKSRFFFIWIRHHYRWLAANFDLHIYARHSWSLSYEQWGFFSVPHLLWHGAFVYNGHLRGPMTLTPIAERLAVELWLLFNDLGF